MQLRTIMIDAHPHGKLIAVFLLQIQQSCLHLWPHHWRHRVGQHEHFEPAPEGLVENGQHVRIHKGFAAGKANLLGAQIARRDFIKVAQHICGG